jgi:hypothetical protein
LTLKEKVGDISVPAPGSPRAMPGNDTPQKPAPKDTAREERLAAKLRENLRRRKTQARAMDEQTPDEG